MLGDDADESLDGTENDAVDHDRSVFLAVVTGIFDVETAGKLIVQLDRPALPGAVETVADMEVKLRTVECSVAGIDGIFLADACDRIRKSCSEGHPMRSCSAPDAARRR